MSPPDETKKSPGRLQPTEGPSGNYMEAGAAEHDTTDCTDVEATLAERWRDLPAGHYAVDMTDDDGQRIGWHHITRTVRKKRGQRMVGREAIRHNLVFGRGLPFTARWTYDYSYRVENVARVVLAPRAHSLRYAEITGSCGVCGRTLTNPVSVAHGIGPVCLAKLGG